MSPPTIRLFTPCGGKLSTGKDFLPYHPSGPSFEDHTVPFFLGVMLIDAYQDIVGIGLFSVFSGHPDVRDRPLSGIVEVIRGSIFRSKDPDRWRAINERTALVELPERATVSGWRWSTGALHRDGAISDDPIISGVLEPEPVSAGLWNFLQNSHSGNRVGHITLPACAIHPSSGLRRWPVEALRSSAWIPTLRRAGCSLCIGPIRL